MRIVAVADTHLFHDELVVPDGDVFVHAGDLCRGGSLEELGQAVDWIRGLPHRTKVIVAGNHDFAFVEHAAEARALVGDFVYLEDSGAAVDGVSFWGSPWQPAYNDWAFNLPRGAALAEKWALVPDGTDVLITHGPPMGIGDRGPVAGRLGCEDLLARVQAVRPKAHFFGHIHQDGGVWRHGETLFVNATTWECERQPTVIDLDARGAREIVVPPAHR
ncbi:MAG TPA: metallophosphatase domain-containing protein [Polyangiaceae bacterium]|jgi:predicted phosphohydrolase